jgi:hypothetical protein
MMYVGWAERARGRGGGTDMADGAKA